MVTRKNMRNVPVETVDAGKGVARQILIGPGEAPNFSMRRFVIQPGGCMPKHTNTVEHEQFVLQGRARIGIGEQVMEVHENDVVYIPAGVPHWYEATSDAPFVFLCMVPNQEDRMSLLDGGGDTHSA